MAFPLRSLALTVVAALSSSETVLIGRGNTLVGWELSLDPGTGSARVSSPDQVVPWSLLPFALLSYDFTSGAGWSVMLQPESDTASRLLAIPAAASLCFSAYNPANHSTQITAVVTDSAGVRFGTWPMLQPRSWTNFTLALNDSDWTPMPANSTWTLPLTNVALGVSKNGQPNDAGVIGIADVYVTTTAPAGSIPLAVVMSVLQPRPDTAGVLVAGSGDAPVEMGVQVTNRLSTPCDADVLVQAHNSSGVMGEGVNGFDDWVTCATAPAGGLLPWTAINLTCTVDASVPTYVSTRVLFRNCSCWTVNDTTAFYEMAVAVVPPQPAATVVTAHAQAHKQGVLAKARNSNVFGGQMTPTAAATAAIGMKSVRFGPLWRWVQSSECWNDTSCFNWVDGDDAFNLAAAGVDLMLDAREIAPAWAAASNTSGPSWAEFPGPDNNANYQRYLTLMFNRYGNITFAIEVSNEDDGLTYFQPQPIPMDYNLNLSLALINLTAAAGAASPATAGTPIVGLSSSMFDVKQLGEGNPPSVYSYYETQVLNSPGVMSTLAAASPHPYQNGVCVPWCWQPWGNITFMYANETHAGMNSTVAQLMVVADLMKAAAVRNGDANYTPVMLPSEFGYAFYIPVSATSGWAHMHGAVIAQALVHMRSAPLSQFVAKAFLFAAYDGCCEESNTFYGIWRPVQVRFNMSMVDPSNQVVQPSNLGQILPLPGVSAYATASVYIDTPSSRAPGVFVIDNSESSGVLPAYAPSCVAFESLAAGVQPLAVLFIAARHFNDRTAANVTVSTAQPQAVQGVNGYGVPLAQAMTQSSAGATVVQLSISALPQYLLLPEDTTAAQVCATLLW